MNHKLRFNRKRDDINITIVGIGGTGGFVAESVCRLMTGTPGAITLVDHDRVERHNILRQNFFEPEIGAFKAEAMAARLARNYRRPIDFSTERFDHRDHAGPPGVGYNTDLIIGCVDNGQARAEIAQWMHSRLRTWWIDTGNGSNWGQILIGNATAEEAANCAFTTGWCAKAPLPSVQMPELLTHQPPVNSDLDCAQAILLSDQDPTINQTIATWATAVTKQLITGECELMSLYVDQQHGVVTPRYATPEAVSRVLGTDQEELFADHGADEHCDKCRRFPGYLG